MCGGEGIVEREVPVCGVRICGKVEELWRGRVCEEGGGVCGEGMFGGGGGVDVLFMWITISLVRALFRHLEWRYHRVPWPSTTLPVIDLFEHMLKRINEASVSKHM